MNYPKLITAKLLKPTQLKNVIGGCKEICEKVCTACKASCNTGYSNPHPPDDVVIV